MRCISICGIAVVIAASLVAQDNKNTQPTLIYRSEPEYSAEATLARVQATIMLGVIVGEDGKARDIHVTNGAGFGLDEKAVEAMTKWRFNPATLNGQPTAVPANIEMNFTILAKNDKADRTGQRARLNFTLPANTTRPRLVAGALPANPSGNGDQLLRFHLRVDADGNLREIKSLSSTDPAWEKLVLRVVQAWRFQPATLNGTPVAAEADFELQHIASAEPPPILIEPPANVATDEPDEPRAIAPRKPPQPVAIPGLLTRSRHTATLLPNGTVLIAGGIMDSHQAAHAQIFDWATRHIVNTSRMNEARWGHTATLLRDGTVLIVGGRGAAPLASAEIFDPSTGTFGPTGSLHEPRESHIAIALPDGRVLIAGGKGIAGRDLATTEIYNPRTKTFTPATPLAQARSASSAIGLKNGRVLVVGASIEIYDPASATFAPAIPVAQHHFDEAALLNSGKVLLSAASGSTEIYNPEAGTFEPGPTLTSPGEGHTATVLQDGAVLIAGVGAQLLTIN